MRKVFAKNTDKVFEEDSKNYHRGILINFSPSETHNFLKYFSTNSKLITKVLIRHCNSIDSRPTH